MNFQDQNHVSIFYETGQSHSFAKFNITQAYLDLKSQLDSQNISNIADPSTTPLKNKTPILLLSPLELANIEPTNNPIKQMEFNHTVSESLDNNDVPSQNPKYSDQSISTLKPSKEKYDIMKDPTYTNSLKRQFHFQISTYITVYAPYKLHLQTL